MPSVALFKRAELSRLYCINEPSAYMQMVYICVQEDEMLNHCRDVGMPWQKGNIPQY